MYTAREYAVDSGAPNLGRVVTDTWRSLSLQERMPYESVAGSDMIRFQRENRSYQEVQRRYTELRAAAEQDGKSHYYYSQGLKCSML